MWARRLQSDILLADASHTFADVLTTIVFIAGWQLYSLGYLWLVRVCALAVAALVLYLSYSLFKRAAPILVDQFAINPELLSQTIGKVAGVCEIKRVRSRWIGSGKAIDLIISVDPKLTTDDSHKIASSIEQLIEEEFDVSDISIHIEPFHE